MCAHKASIATVNFSGYCYILKQSAAINYSDTSQLNRVLRWILQMNEEQEKETANDCQNVEKPLVVDN